VNDWLVRTTVVAQCLPLKAVLMVLMLGVVKNLISQCPRPDGVSWNASSLGQVANLSCVFGDSVPSLRLARK